MKKANVFNKDVLCGYLIKDDEGFLFEYEDEYLNNAESSPISLTMLLSNKKFRSDVLFPSFDGLIPEGYYLDLTIKTFNLNPGDRFDILLNVGKSTIGSVSIEEASGNE